MNIFVNFWDSPESKMFTHLEFAKWVNECVPPPATNYSLSSEIGENGEFVKSSENNLTQTESISSVINGKIYKTSLDLPKRTQLNDLMEVHLIIESNDNPSIVAGIQSLLDWLSNEYTDLTIIQPNLIGE